MNPTPQHPPRPAPAHHRAERSPRFRFAIACLIGLAGLLRGGTVAAQAALRETVVIAAEDDWYPYGGAINGKTVGLGPDLVRASFAAMGVRVEYRSVPYARCLTMAIQGTVLACLEPARTAQTEAALLWPAKPLFSARSMIYARSPSSESGLTAKSLEGKTVIVTNGYEYGSEFDGNAKIKREHAIQDVAVFRMLKARRANYALAYEKVAHHLWAKHADEFAGQFVAVGMIAQTDMYCGFSKTFPEAPRYLKLFNEGFAKISANGELKAIEARWP